MFRSSIRVLSALVVVSVALAAHQAQAGWRHHGYGGSYGSYGSYGSHGSWGSSGGSWGSSGGSWGSSGGSWGSSGGSWGSSGGSWGSSGGSWGSSGGSWGSSGGSWGSSGGSCGSSGGGYHAAPAMPATPVVPAPGAAPATPPGPAPEGAPQGPAPQSSTYHPTYGPMRDSARLAVKVPADAQVFVNDRPTTSTGMDREYISRDLQAGANSSYSVRAEFVRDGQPVSEVKTVQLTAGQGAQLDFTQGAPSIQTASAPEARTTLTVRLPADAKLYLGGHETKATGPVREFSTTRLPNGSEWTTYAVRAVIERDGKQEVREESISLKAGDSRELSINFDSTAKEQIAETASR